MGVRRAVRRFEDAAVRRPLLVALLAGVAASPLFLLVAWWKGGTAWLQALVFNALLVVSLALFNLDRRNRAEEYERSRQATIEARQRRLRDR